MLITLRKVTNLELIGEISDDVNRDQYILLNVEPVETVNPVDQTAEQVLKVAVHNGLAVSINPELAKWLIANRDNPQRPETLEGPTEPQVQ